MKKISTEYLSEIIEACEKLLKGYVDGEGLRECSLCRVCFSPKNNRTGCNLCPHVFVEGRSINCGLPCTQEILKIYNVRMSPRRYPEETKQRIEEITKWIGIINAEIERRNNV